LRASLAHRLSAGQRPPPRSAEADALSGKASKPNENAR
jgi:hypothetical protein